MPNKKHSLTRNDNMLDKLRQEVIEFNKFRKEVMKIYQEQISFSAQISAAVV